jgi:hypothetical protein
MAMAITMRMLARIFFFATEVTQGPLLSQAGEVIMMRI